MKRRLLMGAITALAALGLPGLRATASEVSGIQVADQIRFGGQMLILNGVGIRRRFGLAVYVCGLYLQTAASTLSDIIALPGAKRIFSVMLRDVSSDELADAFLAGIRHNSSREQTQLLGLQLVKLGQLSVTIPRLRSGDVLTYDFDPTIGSSMSINGRTVIEPTADSAFFEALLRIWIGDHPADDVLKDRLLGRKTGDNTFNTGFRSGG